MAKREGRPKETVLVNMDITQGKMDTTATCESEI